MSRRRMPYRALVAAIASLAAGLSLGWYGLRADPRPRPGADSGRPVTPDVTGPPGAGPTGTGSIGPAPGADAAVPPHPDAAAVDGGAIVAGPLPPGVAGPIDPGRRRACTVGGKLVPTCGVLWGVAPGAHTDRRGQRALREFERKTGRTQSVFHAYHRGAGGVFPTREQITLSRQPGHPRVLFLNWKPATVSWRQIARGDRRTNAFLDRLAAHIRTSYPERFFFTVHHEPEDEVRENADSGYTAADYAAMFRHVVRRLRARGVQNMVTVVVHMAYVPLTSRPWFARMYPGDDVVDWVGFDTYAYSDPGYGHGDFAELMNRRSGARPTWPGFYNWAVTRYPDKPIMVAEWGVWHSKRNPAHKARFYRSVAEQIGWFPRVKALVHFDTPSNQRGWDSRVDSTRDALAAYRRLGALPIFDVNVARRPRPAGGSG